MCFLFLKDYYAENEGIKHIIKYCCHTLCELLLFVRSKMERTERTKERKIAMINECILTLES